MSLPQMYMGKTLRDRIIQRGPPIPVNSIIVCRMCKTPVYYTVHGFTPPGIIMPYPLLDPVELCIIASGPLHRPDRRHLCSECFHEIFSYSHPAVFFIPFPGTLSLMQALHSVWRI